MNAEELLQATEIGRCELIRGELHMLVTPGAEHGRIAMSLARAIAAHGGGTVFAAGTGFLLARDPDTVRAPDVGFVRAGRPPAPPRGYYPGPPDLAVEVLSPDDRPGYVRDKVAEWLDAGAVEVWVGDPRKRTIAVHGPDPRELGEEDTLRDSTALSGFEISVRDVFA